MQIQVLVTLEVSSVDDRIGLIEVAAQAAAHEAVFNVLHHAQGVGFPHSREADVSIILERVEVQNRFE